MNPSASAGRGRGENGFQQKAAKQYKKYKLTKEDVSFIESMIKPME